MFEHARDHIDLYPPRRRPAAAATSALAKFRQILSDLGAEMNFARDVAKEFRGHRPARNLSVQYVVGLLSWP